MGDRMHGFNVLRRPLSPVITGSNNFLSIPGAALAYASLPPGYLLSPMNGAINSARLRLARLRFVELNCHFGLIISPPFVITDEI